jgi:hypothetical protein
MNTDFEKRITVMRFGRHSGAMLILATTILFSGVVSCFGANLPEELAESDRYFGNGGTNVPLLELDWFSGTRTVEYCRVSQSGNVSSARNVINWAIQGGHRAQLDQTNLELLAATMNSLPLPAIQTLPKERLLVVRGLRTNQWFKFTYPSSIVVYDALNWKPLAHWKCGQVMSDAKFDFASDGEFIELRDHDLTGLDVKSLAK